MSPEKQNETAMPPLSFRRNFRTRIVAGLALLLPIWVTIFMVRFIFGLLRDASWWVVEAYLLSPAGKGLLEKWNVKPADLTDHGQDALPTAVWWSFGALCVVLTVVLLYVLGAVTANVFGKRLVRLAEALVDRVPVVKTFYRSSKQVLETFTGDNAQAFQRVVLVPFPSAVARSIGFVTKTSKDSISGEEIITVFVPTTPNPTGGYVFVLRKTDAVELDWSVEEALKVVLSGGLLMPQTLSLPPTQHSSRLT